MSIPHVPGTQKPEQGTCANVNECVTGDHRCDENADCRDEIASKDNLYNFFTCHCHVGYDGDGMYCEGFIIRSWNLIYRHLICRHFSLKMVDYKL